MNSPSPSMTPTRDAAWLTPAEQKMWRTFVDGTRLLLDALERQLQAESGMPLTYYELLVTLSEAPDCTLRMGVLGKRVRSSSARLAHAVTRLEEFGWVRRESTPGDRRGQFAVLTEQGLQALEDAAPGHVAAVRRHLLNALTHEQVMQLTAISEAVLAVNSTDGATRDIPVSAARAADRPGRG